MVNIITSVRNVEYLGPFVGERLKMSVNPENLKAYAITLQKDSIIVGHVHHAILCICMII